MAEAGADQLVAHVGLTTAGSIGAGVAFTLDQAIDRVMAIAEAGRSGPRATSSCICHGGPFDEPAQVGEGAPAHARGRTASSAPRRIERLPTERAIRGQVQEFKRLAVARLTRDGRPRAPARVTGRWTGDPRVDDRGQAASRRADLLGGDRRVGDRRGSAGSARKRASPSSAPGLQPRQGDLLALPRVEVERAAVVAQGRPLDRRVPEHDPADPGPAVRRPGARRPGTGRARRRTRSRIQRRSALRSNRSSSWYGTGPPWTNSTSPQRAYGAKRPQRRHEVGGQLVHAGGDLAGRAALPLVRAEADGEQRRAAAERHQRPEDRRARRPRPPRTCASWLPSRSATSPPAARGLGAQRGEAPDQPQRCRARGPRRRRSRRARSRAARSSGRRRRSGRPRRAAGRPRAAGRAGRWRPRR